MSCQNRLTISGAGSSCQVSIVNSNRGRIKAISLNYGYSNSYKSFSFTITDSEANQMAYLVFEPIVTGATFSDIESMQNMVELGSTASNFEPYQGETYDITFPSEAGTVYGGTLDVTTGVLTVLGVKDTLTVVDGKLQSQFFYESTGKAVAVLGDNVRIAMNRISQTNNMNTLSSSYSTIMANLCPHYFAYNSDTAHWYVNNQLYLYLPKIDVGDTLESYKTFLQDNPFEVYIPFATPQTYQLTPQEVHTLLGQNNIWADTGDVSLLYPADTKAYIDNQIASTRKLIAGIETEFKASKAYSVGDMLIIGNDLYKVSASIASGATITVGTNVTKTTVAEQLIALANA